MFVLGCFVIVILEDTGIFIFIRHILNQHDTVLASVFLIWQPPAMKHSYQQLVWLILQSHDALQQSLTT